MSRTVYDDVYKTIIEKMPEYIVPVINEVFGTDYAMSIKVIQQKNEYMAEDGKIIVDSVFVIGDEMYHVEIQSYPDGTMAIRMFRYDLAIAMSRAVKNGGRYKARLPKACVLYVRDNNNTPGELSVELVSGEMSYARNIPVIRMQGYSIDEIFRKNLLLFIPYYIVRYERRLESEARSGKGILKETLMNIERDYREIYARLAQMLDKEHSVTKSRFINMIDRVATHMLSNITMSEEERQEVKSAMGGQVLELEVDIAMEEGEKRGIIIGEKIGENRRAEQTFRNMINRSYDVEEAIAISGISRKAAYKIMKEMLK